MKEINHECYVSLEVAKLLKEAGFDWEVDACYTYGDYFDFLPRPKNCNEIEHWHSAPTLSIAQKWLREVKNISVWVYRIHLEGCDPSWGIAAHVWTNLPYRKALHCQGIAAEACKTNNTYEEALEIGIKQCLTLLTKEE